MLENIGCVGVTGFIGGLFQKSLANVQIRSPVQ